MKKFSVQNAMLLSSTTISFVICLYIIFYIVYLDGVVSAQSKDSQEMCEDEITDRAAKQNSKCFNCTSNKHGIIECVKLPCPRNDGCYLLQSPDKDECCEKCKGCTKNGLHYESGTKWTDPKNPCRLLECIAGVITSSELQCYTPCDNPTSPSLGECCSTCPDCNVEGEPIIENTLILPDTDPCVMCECDKGVLTCTKKICPVLNCPESNVVQDFSKCCPICLGSRKFMDPPKGSCLLNMKLYQSGKQFSLDNCTDCKCKNLTVHCKRQSCPVLKCKRDNQKILPGQCCAQCEIDDNENENFEYDSNESINDQTESYQIKPKNHCIYEDEKYKNGQTWNTTACEICTCRQGNVHCTPITCPALNCPKDSTLKIPVGECCPICTENEGICSIFGGTHFRTFDGKVYAFLGSCKYELVNDCDDETFNIRLKNAVVKNDATMKKVSLKFGNTKVDLQQNKNVKVNDRIIDLPYKLKNKLEINEVNENIFITTNIMIKILWNYMGFLEITVPRSYRKNLCGLCGNFNDVADDDLTTKEGILVTDPTIFAQSWTAGNDLCFETKKYGIRGCNPQKDQRLCSYIKGSVFEKCLRKLNVSSYYEKCLKDMCDCPPEDLQCHCESFTSYVNDCDRLGILLPKWEESVGC